MEYCKENDEMFRMLMETEPWSYNEDDKTVENSIGDIMIAQCEDEYAGRKLAMVPSLIRAIEFAYDFWQYENAAQVMDETLRNRDEFSFEFDHEYGFEPDNLDVVERLDKGAAPWLPYWVLTDGGFVKAERIYNYMVAEMVSLYVRLSLQASIILMWGVNAVEENDFNEALELFEDWKESLGIR